MEEWWTWLQESFEYKKSMLDKWGYSTSHLLIMCVCAKPRRIDEAQRNVGCIVKHS